MLSRRHAIALLAITLLAAPLLAQPPAPPISSQPNPDSTLTFRYKDPTATKVELSTDASIIPIPLEKDAATGIWSATTPVLPPHIYSYHFTADGLSRLDPGNPRVTVNLRSIANMIELPGASPQPWDANDVPHGLVHHHTYTSTVVLGLPQNQDQFYVYTPPNYDPGAKTRYPVLYLLHGYSDDASGWTAVGQANYILDNLIAGGKIKPMIVVMPLGYGDMSFVNTTVDVWRTPATVDHNVELYTKALLTEVLPRVEATYHVSARREDRAIAGLSMGGLESLSIGLLHPDLFAYVGGFSSGLQSEGLTDKFTSLDPKSANLRLLWIACGTSDHLIDPNRKFIAFLKSKNMPVTTIETPGQHTWLVWRDNLIHFTPLLFQSK